MSFAFIVAWLGLSAANVWSRMLLDYEPGVGQYLFVFNDQVDRARN